MILVDLRSAIVSMIQAAVPSLQEVKAHGGRFTLEELKAYAAKSPSVRVACLGLPQIFYESGMRAVSAWGAFVIAGDKPGLSRDVAALEILAAIAPIVPGNCWGLEDSVDSARDARADNLFSRELDKNGIALWGLTWRHIVDLALVDAASLDDLLTVVDTFDIDTSGDGEPELADTIQLQGGS